MTISFFVPGIPKPAGSKRVFPIRKGGVLTGKFIVTDASGHAGKDWRADVRSVAKEVAPKELLHGPLELQVEFFMPRPRSHFGTGRNAFTLRADAPIYHMSQPDATKLLRAIEDSLTNVLWEDDRLIAVQKVSKVYGPRPGAFIEVGTLVNENKPETKT